MSHISERFRLFHVGRLAALTILTIVVSTCFELTQAQEPSHTALASAGDVGEGEILFRRIKRNELETIQVCRDSVAFILVARLLGPLLPPATNTENSAKETIAPRSLGGYYYRILTRQGRHAPGGARDYVVNGTMTGGFALVAYPTEYRSSGVMTFVINLDGVVHQKDLGPGTASLAKTITEYDPDATWKKVP
jgi:DUF2950 family protein